MLPWRAAAAVVLLQMLCARAWHPTAPALAVRRTALMGAPGRGFGGAAPPPEKTKQKKKKPPAAPALDEPARRELALQALQFALDVMLRIQEPSAAFLASHGSSPASMRTIWLSGTPCRRSRSYTVSAPDAWR